MYVVIFRARVRNIDDEYVRLAKRLRDLAFAEFGCLGFHALSKDGREISLSYWPDEESIRAWKAHPEHLLAQKLGKERYYESYTAQVAQVCREYGTK